jgi:glycosyltransferase involved in cell wall biosynthesis
VTEYVRDGQTGALGATGDVAGLAAAVVALLGDDAERTRRGAAARQDVQARFNWETLSLDVEDVYAGS